VASSLQGFRGVVRRRRVVKHERRKASRQALSSLLVTQLNTLFARVRDIEEVFSDQAARITAIQAQLDHLDARRK